MNVERCEKKLPSLLAVDDSTNRVGWAEQARIRYRLKRFKEDNPKKHALLMLKLEKALAEIKQAIEKGKN